MNTIQYLKEVYGYGVPIFLDDIRIGGKSKTAIRQSLSRAVKNGEIKRKDSGIYFFTDDDKYPSTLLFEKVIEFKYVKNDYGLAGLNVDVYGYYTGQTFLHMIGISQQVPAVLEVTSNNTSCKRTIKIDNRKATLRKGKTEINKSNYKALQFFDMFSFLNDEEIEEHKGIIEGYIRENLTKNDVEYLSFYGTRVLKIIFERGFINAFR